LFETDQRRRTLSSVFAGIVSLVQNTGTTLSG
jgi:hypothetical protein